ncbi:histidinol dehydrogenase [Nesterenkonia halotolerans]|uniref:Histidinol dehydrogenase n=1 Tax=Nesterenkonia halotolerans TaxID=225325 RepID=A0ABR9J828_9MICC|nr:histidinol dehydrogenase [Nesterenkonia halotolerans]MBE1515145.1 sulfopropanediol 3-dehydrogenase [Nesterenkonia halotolerans]
MRFSPQTLSALDGKFSFLKAPSEAPAAQYAPKVTETVSSMLADIEGRGLTAVEEYALKLDNYSGDFVVSQGDLESSGERLPTDLREAIELGSRRTKAFAAESRRHLRDFEYETAPGVVCGVRYVPIRQVGAYLPAGRFPLTASAFMSIGVAKEAGVPLVTAATPPGPDGRANDAVLYAAYLSGVDRMYVLGGVQALATLAFGLLDELPSDMLVGAGNAFVAEAKRQLFGRVAIDLPAGPSEVAVIADDTAEPEIVAADLLGQAEHGPQSPAALVTTSPVLAQQVSDAVDRQLATLSTHEIAGPAWRDFGSITVADTRETAAALMDDLAPEHLEVITSDDDWYHDRLRNYGSIFLGPWSTVAYSDKGMAGTNHTLPTAGGAKHSAGLSVSRFVKPLTYQRVAREATPSTAEPVRVISDAEGMEAHSRTATYRLDRYQN